MGVDSIPANLVRYRKAKEITMQQIANDIGILFPANETFRGIRNLPIMDSVG